MRLLAVKKCTNSCEFVLIQLDGSMEPWCLCQNSFVIDVRVFVTLKPSLLDSAGRTLEGSLKSLGFEEVDGVRIGKLIELKMDKFDEARVRAMCEKLLANSVIEDYEYEVFN